jgi:hypothetical protein
MATKSALPDNLWPPLNDLASRKEIPPRWILEEQARFLSKTTKSVLEGVIESSKPEPETGKVFHNFYVQAPLLRTTRVKLFYVGHDITLYPAYVSIGSGELFRRSDSSGDLKKALFDLFKDERTLLIIGNLLASSKAPMVTVPDPNPEE